MRKLFWYGSLIGALLIVGIFSLILIGIALGPHDGPALGDTVAGGLLMITGALVLVPTMMWYTLANLIALSRVMKDPHNTKKPLWLFGWAFANIVMHAVFIYQYVFRSPES